jgi:hypothetical protein
LRLIDLSAKREILCGFEISLRENATTHNYTPQKLLHTNSPMAHYHQYPNCNLKSRRADSNRLPLLITSDPSGVAGGCAALQFPHI